jgi:hypothetical protein
MSLGRPRAAAYAGPVSSAGEPAVSRVAAAPGRTVAAGTARVFFARGARSPVPGETEQSGEGVADLRARHARVMEVLLPASFAPLFAGDAADDPALTTLNAPRETIYDGANAYLNVGGQWTGFFLGDPAGPRGSNDPLWPLDALFGAREDVVPAGREDVRGVAADRYRLTVDLARADAALPAGVSVPAGPYRGLLRMPAEVWLDAAGLVRRVAVSAEPVPGPDVPLWSVTELWDFGLAVHIVAPRPDEVAAPRDVDWDPGSARREPGPG